jgi:dUTP pyrophosphatase
MDLFACVANEVRLQPLGEPELISSGLAVRIDDPSWCALIVPRSGLGHQSGLILGNGVGIIDADYEGPCFISAWNRNHPNERSDNVIVIRPGDRIAQLIFVHICRPQVKIVAGFAGGSKRGGKGIGSTGIQSTA